MKRFHVHLHVNDLATSIAFYSRLFGAAPTRAPGGISRPGGCSHRRDDALGPE